MAKAKNRVIAGDYEGKRIALTFGSLQIQVDLQNTIYLSNDTVSAYEVITDEHRKSAKSGVARGLVGGALIGPVGMIAGSMSAKNKGIYQIAIEFKDGKKSLIEVDDKIYKSLIASMFQGSSTSSNNAETSSTQPTTNDAQNDASVESLTNAKPINKGVLIAIVVITFLVSSVGLAMQSSESENTSEADIDVSATNE